MLLAQIVIARKLRDGFRGPDFFLNHPVINAKVFGNFLVNLPIGNILRRREECATQLPGSARRNPIEIGLRLRVTSISIAFNDLDGL